MAPRPLDLDALRAAMRAGGAELPGPAGSGDLPLLCVDLDTSSRSAVELDTSLPFVVLGVTTVAQPVTHPAAGACDLALRHDDPALDAVTAMIEAHPIAATALALVLRRSNARSTDEGLHVESAVYSTLQSGPEFTRWRAAHPHRDTVEEGGPITLERQGDRLDITLTRPHVRNAVDAAMRDSLVEALHLVAVDDTIAEVHLRGAGPSFCAGGDLDEFGTFPDPVSAHLVRLRQSVGRALAAVAQRVTVHLHGACVGSGIELPAFAHTIVASPDTRIALPEVSLGLIPGAGGTISLPRRIGRHRTARLALTGEHLDAATALEWGLIDRIEETDEQGSG